VHEQELVASLQRLDTHAEWQVSYKNKAVTIVLNGVVCFMAGLLLWASVYALYGPGRPGAVKRPSRFPV
jgi:hypothetical protein